MAYVFTMEGGSGATASLTPDSGHSDLVGVPDADLLFNGDFRRVGPDLALIDKDGRHLIVPGYFSHERPAALVAPNGARLSGDLVELLVGSPTPGKYAQTGPTTPSDAIGKVEKVIGNVTVLRNGVSIALNVGDAVYKSDVIQTGVASSIGITFPDGSALSLVANTRMALNEYSYDANSTSNVELISLVEGTFAFVAGKVAHSGDMKIVTPVATMGIRGTTGYVEQVATITANTGNVTYSFVVVDDYATTKSGQYDLIDQSGNVISTVSQTGFITYVTPQGQNLPPLVSTVPMSNSQLAFEQQIIQQVFEALDLNNTPVPHSTGTNGSSSPPYENQNNQLQPNLHNDGSTPFQVNVPIPGLPGQAEPVTITINPPPPPPPASAGWTGDLLVEYYLYPSLAAVYFTSTTFVVPASGVEANPDGGGLFSLTVDASSITASQFTTQGLFFASVFNGFEIVDLSHDPLISGITIDPATNIVGFNIGLVSFDSDAVWINLADLNFDPSSILKLDLTFDPPLDPSHFGAIPILNGSPSPVDNVGVMTVADGTALALAGIIDNTGEIAINASSAVTGLEIDGNVTLKGGGHIELSESNENYIFGSDATLTNVDNTISGSGDIGNGTLVFHNAGVIEALGPYALIIDTGDNPFINTGTLETGGGTLMVQSPVVGGGNAIIAGGTLEFFDASDNNVNFTGGGLGILTLDQSHGFSGQIAGFGGHDQIDLADISFSSNLSLAYAANSSDRSGVLTVSDGTHTADLAFLGDYVTSSFDTSSDGHGGTMLADAAIAATEPTDSTASISKSPAAAASLGVAQGILTFAGAESSSSEAASVTPEGPGYVGSFVLDPVSQSNGSASVSWEFSLENDQISLSQGETMTQSYQVVLDDAQGSVANTTVSVSLGGSGNDSFVFTPGIGADDIVNFNPQADSIELNKFSNIQSMQQLASLITSDTHGDAMIDLGHNDSITLPGMTADQLHAVLQSAIHLH